MDYSKVKEIEQNETLSLKDVNTWRDYNQANKSSYGMAILDFAERWAKVMQYVMREENKTLAEVAVETVDACDISGITGAMYNYAIQVLTQCWEYGDELKQWHQSKFESNEEEVKTM